MKKKKRYYLIAVPLALLALPALYSLVGQRASREYMGIKLGATQAEVREALGAPEKEGEYPDELMTYWIYPRPDRHVTVGFVKGGRTLLVTCQGSACPPLRGIRPEDSLDAVVRRFGPPTATQKMADGLQLLLRYRGRNLGYTVDHLLTVISLSVIDASPSYDEKDLERLRQERAKAARISEARAGERPGEGPVTAALRKVMAGEK